MLPGKPPLGRRGRGPSKGGLAAAASAASASRLAVGNATGGNKSSRDSPARVAKTAAIEKLREQYEITPRQDSESEAALASAHHNLPVIPPLWNAYWCDRCSTINLVGDGGLLHGPCIGCGIDDITTKNSVMLDPHEFSDYQRNVGKKYDNPSAIGQNTTNLLSELNNNSPTFENSNDDDYLEADSYASDRCDDVGDDGEDLEDFFRTDAEVSKYCFYERLEHYMQRTKISLDNRKAVELAIMIEAGTNVRDMLTMNKESRENKFHSVYLRVIKDIPNECFEDDLVIHEMLLHFKGSRKKSMDPGTLYRKYETELKELRKFAVKIPGISSLNKLPSGTTELNQMREPIIRKLWIQKYPDRVDVNYDDPGSVSSKIPSWWWLHDDKCKYILSCLVHKDNKDLSTCPSNFEFTSRTIT